MATYSHSQLSTYEECPLKYKLCYRDGIKRDTEGIEAFVGNMVHETLKKCYNDAKFSRLPSLDELLAYYDDLWQKRWHDSVVIVKKDLGREHYQTVGKKMLSSYYRRHAPFDEDITIGTEMMIKFNLDDGGRYQIKGFIDRLSKNSDGTLHINDYKTSSYLPAQEDIDNDRQLALYQMGVQKKWPNAKKIKLVWHYLAFDHELVSQRSDDALAELRTRTIHLIDDIESAEEFPPKESALCDWCEYPDLCPMRKHYYTVENLPTNEFLNEPGVALVNRYAELKKKAEETEGEIARIKEALIDYARREGATVLKGSYYKVRVKFDEKLKFPGKNEAGREELDRVIKGAGKWPQVSQLDTTALARAVEGRLWDKELTSEVMKYCRIEEASSVYLSKLVGEETTD